MLPLYKQHINQAITALGYQEFTSAQIYAHVDDILAYIHTNINAVKTISSGTTGAMLERLCRYGLDAAVAATHATVRRMPAQWEWLGDYYLSGDPFNLVISCKSFTAKERLLASGTGSVLSPTVGWGSFKKPDEFSLDRILSYAYRGFVAIYMPEATRDALSAESLAFTNINGRPFIRARQGFVADIHAAINSEGRINPRAL